ncbi:hypothetical protein LV79_001869 [Actinokineospora globicatena]|uniref:Uncharacterized protein n=1 Tax=Actinokineospora globicatena TaxID=103729 RepID=A0A9W6QV89_9PSEU|nr:hypothetical protein [Actinokineospora globicatena]GLW76143.1 hypothetical protein Aglo01_06250 [Actinokineospora globicatena]GLW82979.1 hypothetical protein Aglo02_06190 [Actinokineospora globicatena]GLW95728.1 hypothetical protein Aglo03_65440 [Actinokineospora globicatena]
MDDSDPARRKRLTEAAAGALAAMRAGEDDGALDRVAAAVRATPDSHADASELMLLLFHECSAMVSALGSGGTTPVKMQVYDDDGHEVPIDEADPPVRTAVRTLLAQVHGDTDGAKAQIDIALTNAAPEEMATLMVQALRWTLRLSEECLNRALPIPTWLHEA